MRFREWTDLLGFHAARAGGRAVRVLGVLAILGLSLAPVANASTNFTWSGGANEGVPKWSTAANWESGTAPESLRNDWGA